jgi:hypothetical protein
MTDNYHLESETDTFGARLECRTFEPKKMPSKTRPGESVMITTVQMGNVQAECSADPHMQIGSSAFLDDNSNPICEKGPAALELVLTLDARGNDTTLAEKKACQGTVVFAWVRKPEGLCEADLDGLNAENSLFLQCHPTLIRGKWPRYHM